MAIAKGQQTKESAPRKKYIGVSAVKILAVNPTKEELEKIYDHPMEKEPVYSGVTESDGQSHKWMKIDFIVQSMEIPDFKDKISFFLSTKKVTNGDKSKARIMDKYGRTAWATRDEVAAKAIPQYSNGPARIDSDYRVLYAGEYDLTNFIKKFLAIENVDVYNGSTWEMSAHPENCEVRLDTIEKIINGDITEIKEAINFQPNNFIKVVWGVKHSQGNTYQTCFTGEFAVGFSKRTTQLSKALDELKERGYMNEEEYSVEPIKEYSVEPTDLSSMVKPVENPFGENSTTTTANPFGTTANDFPY